MLCLLNRLVQTSQAYRFGTKAWFHFFFGIFAALPAGPLLRFPGGLGPLELLSSVSSAVRVEVESGRTGTFEVVLGSACESNGTVEWLPSLVLFGLEKNYQYRLKVSSSFVNDLL